MRNWLGSAAFFAVVFCSTSTVARACDARLEVPTQTASGALLRGVTCPNAQINWLEQTTFATDEGLFVVGIGRDVVGAYPLTASIDGQSMQTIVSISPREYRISIVEGVPQRTVTPSEEDLIRIRRESAMVAEAKAKVVTVDHWQQPAIEPASGRISGVYGSQRVYNGTPGNPHYGLDIAAPTGTPVVAPLGGVVVLAEDDLFYSGGTIIVAHGAGLFSSFLHLSSVEVEVGQVLERGAPLGKIGSTGRATGPHLDWRMNWRNQRVDTQWLLQSGWPNTASQFIDAQQTN
jgi:murein DD-endopeptidase MepM/ murein hydrolase activator NlpD